MKDKDIKDYKFIFNRANLETIVDTLKDLSKINPMIKMKMDDEFVLFYSRAGAKVSTDSAIHAFKSFVFPITDFIIADEYRTLDFIILNGPNFVSNLEMYLDKTDDVAGKLTYKDKDKVASMLYMTDNKLSFNFVTGDYKQIKDISKGEIDTKMDPDNANYSFTMNKDQFAEVKKLTTKNKAETISIRIKKGKLEFFDKRWSLHICDVPTAADDTISFNNKYLKSIAAGADVIVHVFDQFLLVKDGNANLLIGIELSELK